MCFFHCIKMLRLIPEATLESPRTISFIYMSRFIKNKLVHLHEQCLSRTSWSIYVVSKCPSSPTSNLSRTNWFIYMSKFIKNKLVFFLHEQRLSRTNYLNDSTSMLTIAPLAMQLNRHKAMKQSRSFCYPPRAYLSTNGRWPHGQT